MTSLIDADYLLYVIPHKMKEVSNNYDDFVRELDLHIEYIMQETKCTHYLMFLSDSKNFRKSIAETNTYKGTRPSRKPFLYTDLKNYLLDEYHAIVVDQLEADDMVLIYHNILKRSEDEVIVVSPDKDLRQVAGYFYNPQKDVFETITKTEAQYRFWYSMLVGDSSDNIPGVKGIGKVRASSILQTADEQDKKYREAVLNTYIANLGMKKGINAYRENFNLLYILRDAEDFECNSEPVLYKKEKTETYEI